MKSFLPGFLIACGILLLAGCFINAGNAQSVDSAQNKDTVRNSKPDTLLVEKKIALTFDDGPHPYYTEQLLDGLKERDVKATFFVVGKQAELYPDVIKRMKEDGHLIGNHTYSHLQYTKGNKENFKKELMKTNELLKEITSREVNYVRPPCGAWDKSFEKELDMIPVMWTVDPLDWCTDNVSTIVQRVISKAGEYDIILMHDYYDSSVTAALQIVDILLDRGYTFVTVEDILLE